MSSVSMFLMIGQTEFQIRKDREDKKDAKDDESDARRKAKKNELAEKNKALAASGRKDSGGYGSSLGAGTQTLGG